MNAPPLTVYYLLSELLRATSRPNTTIRNSVPLTRHAAALHVDGSHRNVSLAIHVSGGCNHTYKTPVLQSPISSTLCSLLHGCSTGHKLGIS